MEVCYLPIVLEHEQLYWWVDEDHFFTQIVYLTHLKEITESQISLLDSLIHKYLKLVSDKGMNIQFPKTHQLLRYPHAIKEKGTFQSTEPFESFHKTSVKIPLQNANQKYQHSAIIDHHFSRMAQKQKEFEQFLHQKKNSVSNSKVHTFTNLTRSEIDRVKELMPDAKEITGKRKTLVLQHLPPKKNKLFATNSYHNRERFDFVMYETTASSSSASVGNSKNYAKVCNIFIINNHFYAEIKPLFPVNPPRIQPHILNLLLKILTPA